MVWKSAVLASLLTGPLPERARLAEPVLVSLVAPAADVDALVARTQLLAPDGIVTGRLKSPYSTWRKMARKGLRSDEVLDKVALRVRVDGVDDCYDVLDRIHSTWAPIDGAFDDYIAAPKPNGYQSLHTAVVVPGTGPVEFQVRTHAMHLEAEEGAAAHWRYKLEG